MNKKIFAFVFFLIYPIYLWSQDNVIDEIVWVVGDEAILRSEVEEYRQKARYEGTTIEGDPYCVIPEQLALQKLYLDQAKIDSIFPDEANVNSQVEMRLNYMISQIGSKEKLEEYFGQSLSDMRDELKEMVSNQQVIQQMQRKIVGTANVTPSEVSEFFKTLPTDSIPMIPAQIEVQMITIAPCISQAAIDDVKSKLRDFQKRIENSESEFSTLAILYSEDTESSKNGGELGYMGKGQLVKEYADVAFSLHDKTKVSKIVESEFGFHIIQLIDKQGEKVNTRHILMKPKSSFLEKNQAKQRLDSVLVAIKNNDVSFESAVSLYSTNKNTKNSEGLLTNPINGTSRFQMQELPQEVAKAVYGLKAGEYSAPFSMIDSKGNEVFAIVKVKTMLPAHKANLETDYMAIKEVYQEKKNQEILLKWILEKQKSIYVRIDDKWKNCEFTYPGWIKTTK